jgi:PPM family protein phosphatase
MSEVSRGVTLSFGEVCDRGKVREENQDHVRSASIPLGELFIVADGIGGYKGGATASRLVVEGFHVQLAAKASGYPPDQALQEACTYTNNTIYEAAASGDASLHRMGSTVVLALIRAPIRANETGEPEARVETGIEAWIGHVGDSRAYLIRDGKLTKLTTDHSAVQALVSRNLLTEEEARNHPDSSVLTRSLGHRSVVEIEIDRVTLQAGDALLLCSDGLWGYVPEADIATVATDQSLSPHTVADTLLHQALAAGGHDNIGIEFIRIGSAASSVGVAPAAVLPAAPQAGQSNAATGPRHIRTQQIVAICLLLFGGCGYLAYAAFSHSWPFPSRTAAIDAGRTRTTSQANGPTAGPPTSQATSPEPHTGTTPATKPRSPAAQASEKKILVVGDTSSEPKEKRPPSGTIYWKHVRITREAIPACASHAGERPVLYAYTRKDLKEMLKQHPELSKHVHGVEVLNIDAEISKACGNYDLILILPHKQPAAQGMDRGSDMTSQPPPLRPVDSQGLQRLK